MDSKINMSRNLDKLRDINNKIQEYNGSNDCCESYELYLDSKQKELVSEINKLHDEVFGSNVVTLT